MSFVGKQFRARKKENFYRLGSGFGSRSSQFEKSDPDPGKNHPDPQHLLEYK
jgi:hypothetical protein